MVSIPIELKEPLGIKRSREPISIGVPFPQGKIKNLQNASLCSNNQTVPVQLNATGHWPDGSVKWALLDFQATLVEHETQKLNLSIPEHTENNPLPSKRSTIEISEGESDIVVDTGVTRFYLAKHEFKPFTQVIVNKKNILLDSRILLLGNNKHPYHPIIDKITLPKNDLTQVAHSTKATISYHGRLENDSGESVCQFSSLVTFYANKSFIKWQLTLHNPKAAQHPGGLWDLGDPGSVNFASFSISLSLINTKKTCWKTSATASWHNVSPGQLCIYQASSGGENWMSPNHQNAQGDIPLQFKGYKCSFNGTQIDADNRASPYIHLSGTHGGLTAFVDKFWQNFPNTIETNNDQLTIGLFPSQFSEPFELQGGEKKTHTVYIDFSDNKESLCWTEKPMQASVDKHWYETCQIMPYFCVATQPDPIQDIIQEGLDGENNFFAKREAVDEYGWRNFGDLYADHETLGYEGKEILVSHYNNQYDPLYGFIRQFMLSGDHRWFELANDLAQHITDIDIYHTNEDRCEYNGGLFWHTDHYLDASTCSHRTHSKNHSSKAYQDFSSGGGPGGQHCYTTGLLYHYYLTGSDSSRQAVLTLTDWITNYYEGSNTLCDFLLKIKNKNNVGVKNIMTGQYPLDRGIANYINALMDSYNLTLDKSYLARVENIIQNTVHPNDNLTERQLDNADLNWFYTVLLQAVGRYLDIKESANQLDDIFYYTRDTLLHYASWMVAYEQPYLNNPDGLEFPNHTWAAQDIRKSNVFALAKHYSDHDTNDFFEKENEFYCYVSTTLLKEETRSFTRILAILMQNQGPQSYFCNTAKEKVFGPKRKNSTYHNSNNLLTTSLGRIKRFSPRKELMWLSHRSNHVTKLLRSRR